ncbi:MAG: hypothetical protein LEGION0403_FIIPPAGN_02158 [Legionella sp.]|uniref:hypothetical protein n=1 Tax=Legionella sp. TaxID=459 RepID=UPI003D099243
MKLQSGGGLFVEAHPFPHVFTPLSPECKGATGKGFSFFQHLPGNVLSEVRDLSAEAQEAYDQQYGLVTYIPK